MNIFLLIVLVILIGSIIWGYWRGFVRIVFSIATMAITILLASWINPYITDFIKQNTTIYEDMAERYTKKIQISIETKVKESLQDSFAGKATEGLEEQELFLDMQLPEIWKQQILEKTEGTMNQLMGQTGTYKKVGEYIADKVLQGISFFISFLVISLLLKLLFAVLDVVAKLPLLKGMNRLLGGIIGGIQGFIIVWIILFLVTMFYASPIGQMAITEIRESVFLTYLYQYNPIVYLLCCVLV